MTNEATKTTKKAAAKKVTVSKTETAEVPQKVKKAAKKKTGARKEAAPNSTTKKVAKDTLVSVTFQLAYATRFGQNIF